MVFPSVIYKSNGFVYKMTGRWGAWCLIAMMLIVPVHHCETVAGTVSNLSIYVGDEEPMTDGDAFVMIQGMFHTIRFDIGSGGDILVILYSGDTPPSVKNESNYYEFEYSDGGGFRDRNYGQFLDPGKCSRGIGDISFYVALDPSVSISDWTLKIDVNGNTEYSARIVVKRLTIGLTLSQPEFIFRIDPFTASNMTSEQELRSVNEGNVPVIYSITLDKLSNMVSVSSMDGIVHRKETRYHSVRVSVPKYSPRRIDIVGTFKAEVPAALLKLTGSVALRTSIEQIVNIRILVAHPGYEIINLGDGKIVIQYEKSRVAKYGDVITLRTYYTGRVDVELRFTQTYLEIKDIRLNFNSTSQPLKYSLSETSEQMVDLVVTPIKDDVTASLRYYIESADGTIRYEFTTSIGVGRSSIPYPGESPPILSVAGIIFVAGAILFIAVLLIITRKKDKKKQSRTSLKKRNEKVSDQSSVERKRPKGSKERPKEKLDRKRLKKLERRRARWLKKHEVRVRRRAMKR